MRQRIQKMRVLMLGARQTTNAIIPQVNKVDACVVIKAGRKGGKEDIHRCKICSQIRGRIYRLKEKYPHIVTGFLDLDAEGKQKLYAEASQLFGEHLVKLVNEVVIWSTTRKHTCQFVTDGEFYSEQELQNMPNLTEEEVGALNRLTQQP